MSSTFHWKELYFCCFLCSFLYKSLDSDMRQAGYQAANYGISALNSLFTTLLEKADALTG